MKTHQHLLAIFALLSQSFVYALPAKAVAPLVRGNARFSVLSPECIRIEWSDTGVFNDKPTFFASRRPSEFGDFTTKSDATSLTLETSRVRLTYRPDGKEFHAGNLSAVIKLGGAATTEWRPGIRNQHNLGGTISSLDGVFGPVDLGEGLLSRDGWYLLDDSLSVRLTKDWVEAHPPGVDWYLFAYGKDYKAALRAFTHVSDKHPLPRKYALGSWYSRYWPHSAGDYRRIVEEYQQNAFPLDVMVLDMDWHRDGWTGWSWNRELLPEPKDLLNYLHGEKLAVTLNVHPAEGVGPHEDTYSSFMQAIGADPNTKNTVPFDAGNKRYLDALFETVHQPLEKDGVDFWWLDWQQTPFTPSIPSLTNLAWLNHEYFRHSTSQGKRGLSFSRWAGWGDHRHPIHFSGDASTDWAMLEFEVPFTSTSGNVGCFYWSHDIGGHVGSRDEEAFVRWTQFGALSSALRLHSARNAELDRRPWIYSPLAKQAMRDAFQLRSQLFPYIYSTAWQAHDRSLPPIRPMYLEYPQAEDAYRAAQQYLFGDNLLVAPVTSPGQGREKLARQALWVPKGRWFHWHSGEELSEGHHLLSSSLTEFPLYVRGGVPLPLQSYQSRMSQAPLSELVLRAYPGTKNSAARYELYEDDGLSQGYLRSEYTLTELSYSRRGDEITLTVSPPRGGYQGQVSERSYVIELPATKRATKFRGDFGAVKLSYDVATQTNIIRVPKRDTLRGLRVVIVAQDSPQAPIRAKALRRKQLTLVNEKPGDPLAAAALLKATDPLRESLLALAGLGARTTSDSSYLHPLSSQLLEVSMGVAASKASKAKARVLDKLGNVESVVAELVCDGKKAARCTRRLERLALPSSSIQVVGATRRLEVTYTLKGKAVVVEKPLDHLDATLRNWRIVGPFPYVKETGIDEQRYEPENGPVDLNATFKGIGDKTITWEPREAGLGAILASPKDISLTGMLGYAVTYLRSEQDQQLTLSIGSDDAVEGWLDGKKFHSHNVFRPINDKPDVVKLDLPKGEHTLLFKISNKVAGWSLRVGVEATAPLTHSATPST